MLYRQIAYRRQGIRYVDQRPIVPLYPHLIVPLILTVQAVYVLEPFLLLVAFCNTHSESQHPLLPIFHT
jgi:hypothetical protein